MLETIVDRLYIQFYPVRGLPNGTLGVSMPPSLETLIRECGYHLRLAQEAGHLAVVAVLEPELDSLLEQLHKLHKAP